MAGRSQASNLSGMLGNLANSVGRMGEAGLPYVDTFRRQMAPKADMEDSASLLQYADWAKRNGYVEEARQYMAFGYRQKEKEALEAKESRSRMGESANMYNRQRIADIASDPDLDTDAKKTMIRQAMEAQQAVSKATGISPTKWDSGTSALTAVNKEKADNQYNAKINNMQNVIAEAERKVDSASEAERPAFEASLNKLYERLNSASAEKGQRLGDDMRYKRRTLKREDALDARAEASNDREEQRLVYTIAAAKATQDQATSIKQAEKIAVSLIADGKYEIPKDLMGMLPASTVLEANKLLEDQRKRDHAREEASSTGTVPAETLARARTLAETDKSIATLLKNYESSKAQSVTGGSSTPHARVLTEAVVARDKATSSAGRDVRMMSAVGGKMKALLDKGSYSSWIDGFDDYAEVMEDDEDQFIEMRNAVSTLAKEQGLTPEQITPDVLDTLMDTAAKGLSKEWRNAEQRRSRMRLEALAGWKETLSNDGMKYRESVIEKYSGKTAWLDEDLDELAKEHYNTAIDFYNRLIDMNVDEQNIFLAREVGKNNPIFEPREIGITGFKMPAILDKEEFNKLWEMVKNGQKISINTFIEG